jgi:hypothetical protein
MMTAQASPTASKITLDTVFKSLQHWRQNKEAYGGYGIPEDIWAMIFALEDQGYPRKDLRKMFALNSTQYNKKHQQLQALAKPSAATCSQKINAALLNDKAHFVEANVSTKDQSPIPPLSQAAEQTKQAITQLKSTQDKPHQYVDNATIIVECIHPNGHRLKIHTTNKSLTTIIPAFFQQAELKS